MPSKIDSLRTCTRLLGDVGGTNIRLALQTHPGAPITQARIFRCANFPGIEDAIRHYLNEICQPIPQEAAFGIANPISGDWIQMTNHHWAFSISALQIALGLARLTVINDFTALALALLDTSSSEIRRVGGSSPVAGAPVAVIGAGTGLGVSGVFLGPQTDEAVPISGEGGHVSLAAETELEWQVIKWLSRRYGHASAERAISGRGLIDIYQALRESGHLRGMEVSSAAKITDLALKTHDPLSLATLETFCSFLGNVAGNLALTLGARGGVYIGGGIVPRLGRWFDYSPFRARFENKGRFSAYLKEIPCWVIEANMSLALRGVARALDMPSHDRG